MVLDESSLLQRKGVSPAANRWQQGLVTALSESGLRLRILGHIPEPAWPKGRFWVGNQKDSLPQGIEGNKISYLNFLFARERQLLWRYVSAFRGLCQNFGPPTGVISYNPYGYNAAVGQYAQQNYGVPWICVVADAPGIGPAQKKLDAIVEKASGWIFLAWKSYTTCQDAPKLHLDGGVHRLNFDEGEINLKTNSGDSYIVLYTGAMSKYGGVDFLAEAFTQIRNPHARLVICGPGTSQPVIDLARNDSRIEVLGLVSESELQRLSMKASVFVNPRLSSIPDNQMNFPSKVLEYLSYGKPVISTWTDGLSPAYQKALVVLPEETTACLAQTIEDVLQWSFAKRLAWQKQIETFLVPDKLWSFQGQRLHNWLREYFHVMV